MSLQSFVRWFLPKEDHFYDYLEQQAVVAHETALALAEFKNEGVTAVQTREKVQDFEHKGDKLVHDLQDALAKTFVTPIDREDLQKLSQEIDGILDRANGAARGCALYGVNRPTPPMVELMDKISEATLHLKEMVPLLRKHRYDEIIAASQKLRKTEKEADQIYRAALSELFGVSEPGPYRTKEIDARTLLREREVLEDLEGAIDYCEDVAKTLVNLSVKNG